MAQASRTVNPTPDFMSMMRQIPFMDDQQLAGLTASTAFGALALTEVSRRNRDRLMADARKQVQMAGGSDNTVAGKELAALAQQRFNNQIAADESMGLNNLVAQAEGGGLEFGEPVEMAGGGMIAFESGGRVNQAGEKYYNDPELGRVYEDGSLGFAGPLALVPAIAGGAARLGPLAARSYQGLRALMARYPKTTAGVGVASGIPFGLDALMGDEDVEGIEGFGAASDEVYQGAAGRKGPDRDITGRGAGGAGAGGAAAGRRGISLEDDPRKILEQIRALEKEQGLGEFGAKAKEIREGRKARVEKTIERALASEPYLAGAEAAGQVRPTGRRGLAGLLDVAAPTVAAMGKSAAGIQRQRTDALDKLAEGEERLALAQEQYMRGNIKDATTMANQAKKDMFNADLKLQELGLKQSYYNALGLAAKAKAAGGGGFKLGDVTRATTAINDLQNQLRMLDPKKDKAAIAETQRLIQVLKGGIGVAYARGTGATIEDTED